MGIVVVCEVAGCMEGVAREQGIVGSSGVCGSGLWGREM